MDLSLNAWIFLATVATSPFDASSYLQGKALHPTANGPVEAAAVTGRAVYRIDGVRFLRFDSSLGSVLLPATSDTDPKVSNDFALCPQHLRLLREALLVRDGLPVDKTTRSLEPKLRELIALCRDGRIRGPSRNELTPDGAVVQLQPKEDD